MGGGETIAAMEVVAIGEATRRVKHPGDRQFPDCSQALRLHRITRHNTEYRPAQGPRRAQKKKRRIFATAFLSNMGWTMGLEPTTTGITIQGSTN